MNVAKVNFLNKFIGLDSRQFVIPIYQRKYKWSDEQVSRLLDDVLKASSLDKEHFMGTVVYSERSGSNSNMTCCDLVDGQQRVTTMILIIKALNILSADKEDEADYKYVHEKTSRLLFADPEDHSLGLKICSSKNDRILFNTIVKCETLNNLEKSPIIQSDKGSALYNNFKSIYYRLENEISAGKSIKNDIFNGLTKLVVAEIKLEPGDNPQEIFESLNSLGVHLTNADLIRNFLLMSNEDQEYLYTNYWEPMQDISIGEDNMEGFIYDFLLMKRSYAIKNEDIYKEYVLYANSCFQNGDVNKAVLIKELYEVSTIFRPFIRYSNEYSAETNMLMQELRDMDQTTAYPFLMRVFIDRKEHPDIVSEDVLNKVINLIIVYLVRRTVCRIPSNSLRGFMLNLYNRIFGKMAENKGHYYESIFALLTTITSRDKIPSITEFNVELKTFPLYKNGKFAPYILYRIENGRYPKPYSEFVTAKSITVEHIMPQNLTDEWENDLGENAEQIHDQYLDTIGNLSLSSREKNSSMSDESFSDKKKILETDGSKFEVLNKGIKVLDKFTEQEIVKREEVLSAILDEKYKLETVNTQGIRFEDVEEVIASNEPNMIFNGAAPVSFKLLDTVMVISSYSQLIICSMKFLLMKFPEKIRELAERQYNPWSSDSEKKYLHYDSEGYQSNDSEVGEGIKIYTNVDAMYAIDLIVHVMNECGVEADQLIVYLKKDSIKKVNTFSKKERIEVLRAALQRLKDENLIVYDPENMPNSDAWIKFQLRSLNETIPYDGPATNWDSFEYKSIYYCEYNMANHKLVLTIKKFKYSNELINKLVTDGAKIGITSAPSSGWWHIKEYEIDFDSVVNSTDRISKMVELLKPYIEDLNNFAEQLKSILD